jgi:hypothetical protein
MPRTTRRIGTWALIGAFLILTALVGIHELDHLRGRLDARRCAVCQWSSGAAASVITAVVALLTLLVPLGPCSSADRAIAVTACCRARPSRAPPYRP